MKYIKLFYDWIESTSMLADDEKGRLIDAVVNYARSGVVPELSGNERFVFPMFRLQIDRDSEGYTRAGKSREDHARSREDYARSREDYARSREDQDKDQEKDKDQDNDNEPSVLEKIDENWRTSARARGAAAQLIVDACISQNMPCRQASNLHDEIEQAMARGLAPDEILACCRRADGVSLGYELYAAMKKRGLRPA